MQKAVLGLLEGWIPKCQNLTFRSNFEKIWALDRLENNEFLLGKGNLSSARNSFKGL